MFPIGSNALSIGCHVCSHVWLPLGYCTCLPSFRSDSLKQSTHKTALFFHSSGHVCMLQAKPDNGGGLLLVGILVLVNLMKDML